MQKSLDDGSYYFRRRGLFRSIIFCLLYTGQLVGSLIFLRWLLTDAWNQKSFLISFLFVCAEIIAFLSTALWLFSGLFWLARSKQIEVSFDLSNELDSTKIDLDGEWGLERLVSSKETVCVCVCRYKEPLVDLYQTLLYANNIESNHEIQLYILDDGWYSSTDEHKRTQLNGLRGLFGKPQLDVEDEMPAFSTTQSIYRPDCASECTFLQLQDKENGQKPCTLIARKKPVGSCHYKAGNLNNFLYNFLGELAETNQDVPGFMLILDHDMLPHEDIIEDALSSLQNDPNLAFVQYPQRFHDLRGGDLIHAGNEVFFDGVQINRGRAGLAAFAGTNAVWNIQALLHVGGLQYNTLTEDNSTGYDVHRLGYKSIYSERELAVGQSPQTVKDAMQQRMRWSQGAIEILMNSMASCFTKPMLHDEWISPKLAHKFSNDVPPRPSAFRRLVIFIVYLDSMVYPFYSLGFLLHVAVCILYLATTQAPISPEDPRGILMYWLPLYGVKYCCQLVAFSSVSLTAQWTSQMAWAGYSLSTLTSVGKAVGLRIFKCRSSWFNTGAKHQDTFLLQYGNTIIALSIYLMIVYRGVAFVVVDKTCNAWVSIGSIVYGFVLLFHIHGWAIAPIKGFVRSKKPIQHMFTRSVGSIDEKSTLYDSHPSTKSLSILPNAFRKAREHREHLHTLDFSIFFVVTSVAFLTCILFFWEENSCDAGSFVPTQNLVVDVIPEVFTPPLPASSKFNVEFVAKDRKVLLNGQEFKIKGVNWFGFETELNAPFGLNMTTQDAVMHILVENGFNALRLPLAAESLLSPFDHLVPDEGTVGGGSNPHLNISSYMDLVESFIDRTASWGVFTLLDMHRLRANKENAPYPFDNVTSFEDVKKAWKILTERFCESWSVLGADLMNEPYGVTWGDESPIDWRVLAQDLAETVLSGCPKWMIFIEGQWVLDDAISPVNDIGFAPWGGALTAAKEYPIEISDPSKLIYSPHVYGPGTIGELVVWAPKRNEAQLLCLCGIRSKVIDRTCNSSEQNRDRLNITILRQEADDYCTDVLPLPHQPFPQNMANVWDLLFGFLSDLNYTVIVGEWGGPYVNPTSKAVHDTEGLDVSRQLEVMWNHEFVAYLGKKQLSSFYWSVNPESRDTGGILLGDWRTIDPAKKWLLENLESSNPLSYLGDLFAADALDLCLEKVGAERLDEKFGGEHYKMESLAYNRALDSDRKRPRSIIFPRSEYEVQQIVLCAKQANVGVCTRSGGLSYVGDSTCNGVLVNFRHMRQLEAVDEQRFQVGPGYLIGALAKEMADRGRLIPTGSHGGAGMGWFLGCGHGMLARIYGMGCDNIISARVVTGEGEIIETKDLVLTGRNTNRTGWEYDINETDDGHFALMRALRGIGSCQLGIVTSIQIQTYPLPPLIYYFKMIWPRELSRRALEMWQSWGLNHPNFQFSVRMYLWSPSEEPVDFHYWKDGVTLEGIFIGGEEEFNELLVPPTDALGEPAFQERTKMTYPQLLSHLMGIPDDDDLQLQVPYVGHGGHRRRFYNLGHLVKTPISNEDVSAIADMVNTVLPGAKPYESYLAFYLVGGASASPLRPNVFGHRDVLSIAQYGGYWDDEPSREESVVRHQRTFRNTATQFWGNGAFYNYKDNDLVDWEAAYWGTENVAMLRELKCRYDPLGLFSTAPQSIVCSGNKTHANPGNDHKVENSECGKGLVKKGDQCVQECIHVSCPPNSFRMSTDGCMDSVHECMCSDGYVQNGTLCEVFNSTSDGCGLLTVELLDVEHFSSIPTVGLRNGWISYVVNGSDNFSILAKTYGFVSRVEFSWNNEKHVEIDAPYFMGGDRNGTPIGVPYLQYAGLKEVTVKGCGDDACNQICFETALSIAATL